MTHKFGLIDYTIPHKFELVDRVLKVFPPLTGEEDDPLGLSVQKWEKIVELLENGYTIDDCGHNVTCALCARYSPWCGCNGCPIVRAIKCTKCHKTPYDDWIDACDVKNFSMQLAAAKDMVEFLRSLEEKDGEI